jgi:hypothetical protein
MVDRNVTSTAVVDRILCRLIAAGSVCSSSQISDLEMKKDATRGWGTYFPDWAEPAGAQARAASGASRA